MNKTILSLMLSVGIAAASAAVPAFADPITQIDPSLPSQSSDLTVDASVPAAETVSEAETIQESIQETIPESETIIEPITETLEDIVEDTAEDTRESIEDINVMDAVEESTETGAGAEVIKAGSENEEQMINDSNVPRSMVSAYFDKPEGWAGYTVEVNLYNDDIGDFYTLYLYRQNDYVARERIPVGHYTVDYAMAAGDAKGLYPIVSNQAEFDLTANGSAVLNLTYVGDLLVEEETEVKEATQSTANIDPSNPEAKEDDNKLVKSVFSRYAKKFLIFNGIVIGLLAIVGGVYYWKYGSFPIEIFDDLFKRVKDKKDED